MLVALRRRRRDPRHADARLYRVSSGLKARIEDVIVDESARGQGIGEALVREAHAPRDRARRAHARADLDAVPRVREPPLPAGSASSASRRTSTSGGRTSLEPDAQRLAVERRASRRARSITTPRDERAEVLRLLAGHDRRGRGVHRCQLEARGRVTVHSTLLELAVAERRRRRAPASARRDRAAVGLDRLAGPRSPRRARRSTVASSSVSTSRSFGS